MKTISAFICLFCFPAIVLAQSSQSPTIKQSLSEGARILFNDVKSQLTIQDKNAIYQQLKLKLSKDKKQFLIDEFPVGVQVYLLDLNQDGTEEVFAGMSSTALYGNVGENWALFIKNNQGAYQMQPDLGGGIPLVLPSKKQGFPDIVIGGPGMEFPLYRWDGKAYKYLKDIKDAELSAAKSKDIPALSKSYLEGQK